MNVPKASVNPSEVLDAPEQVEVSQPDKLQEDVDKKRGYKSVDDRENHKTSSRSNVNENSQSYNSRTSKSSSPPSFPPPHRADHNEKSDNGWSNGESRDSRHRNERDSTNERSSGRQNFERSSERDTNDIYSSTSNDITRGSERSFFVVDRSFQDANSIPSKQTSDNYSVPRISEPVTDSAFYAPAGHNVSSKLPAAFERAIIYDTPTENLISKSNSTERSNSEFNFKDSSTSKSIPSNSSNREVNYDTAKDVRIGKSIDNRNTSNSNNNATSSNEVTNSLAAQVKNDSSTNNENLQGLKPSEDLDVSNITTKPPPREVGRPTYRGWKEVGGWAEDDTLTADDEIIDLLSRVSVFDNYIPPYLVGDWYHNVALLIAGALISWLIGHFRFSLGPIFFVVLTFSLLYRTSIRKYRINMRELAQREFSIKVIESDYGTLDWFNNFMEKSWFFLEPSLSQIVCDQVNPLLATAPIPDFIQKVWIDSFSAGTKPPRIDKVKTLQGTKDDIVVMDWGFSFTPNATTDANSKQVKNKVNQNLVLKVKLFGVTIPVSVTDVSVSGLARVRLRMMSSFPHVETVNVSFLQPPVYDFKTTFFGDLGANWEILNFPGLYPFINEMVTKYVGPILFSPLSFQMNVQQLLAGNSFDSAIGVLGIRIKSAKGIKGFTTIGNTLDPFLTFGFGISETLAKTSVKDDTSNPEWNETIYIPVKSFAEPLNIAGIDYNEFRKDKQFGSIKLDLEMLLDNPKQSDLLLPFLRNNKPVGDLHFGLLFMPTIEPETSADGAEFKPPDLNTGIARIEINEGKNLNKGSDKALSTYAEVYINKESVQKSAVQKNTNTPGWNSTQDHIVSDRAKCKVKIVVKTKDGKTIGQVYKLLNDFIDSTVVESPWYPLSNGGEIRVRAIWKPVELENASGAGGYTTPIGAVRVVITKAEDLRNLETIGKVDPYARIIVNGFERARTVTVESTLNPTWNEIHYVTVTSANQKLTIDVMDYESRSPDRTLGAFDFKLSEIINQDEAGRYIEHVDTQKRAAKLIHRKGVKGTVTYLLSFFPALPVMRLEDKKDAEESRKRTIERNKKREEEKANQNNDKEGDAPKVEEEDSAEVEDELDSSALKLDLELEELIEYQSGVLTFEVTEVSTPKSDVYFQFFFDGYGVANFLSQKMTKKGLNKVDITGDFVVKQLDWSKCVIRLTSKKSNNRIEKCLCEYTIPTLQLLKNSYHEPQLLELTGLNEGSMKLQAGWIPIIYENGIPAQDSNENSGILTLYIDKAEDLPAADSNGYSDPFVELYLDTSKEPFFKSKKQKKTLNPKFHETFELELANKHDSEIIIEVIDWDLAGDNDHLGTGYIKLSELTVNEESVEVKTPLVAKDGGDAGVVYFTLKFKPEFVMSIKASSQTGLGDAVGTVGSHGKGAVKTVGKFGIGGVGKGAKLIKKGLHLGKSSDKD